MSNDIVIGKFGRPHGVRGEVRFFPDNPDSELIVPELELIIRGATPDRVIVRSVRRADKFLIVTLDGVDGREQAERLRNKEALVPRAILPEPDPDEFYLVDLIGFEVWGPRTQGAEPRLLGHVKGWLDVGTTDMMAVTGPDISGRLLVPHLDHVVETIDFETRQVHLFPLELWTVSE